jgi:hypothetical protein
VSVKITKKFNPPHDVAVEGWKFFVLHEDGSLGPMQYYFAKGSLEGPQVIMGRPMESEHGYWCFIDRKQMERACRVAFPEPHYVMLPIKGIGLMAEGVMELEGLKCARFKSVLIELPDEIHAENEPAVAAQMIDGERLGCK